MYIIITIIRGVLLGAIQGLTEFLPVSSSGHLILFEKMGLAAPSVETNLFLHLATLLSVLVVMRKDVFSLFKRGEKKKLGWLLVATMPTVAVAFAFKYLLPEALSGAFLAPCFFLSATLLLLPSSNKRNAPNLKNAFLTGLAQGVAVLPGVSRSGTTISIMRVLGIEELEAARLSFLLSFPVIIGGVVLEIPETNFADFDALFILPAFISAFIVGLVSLKVMLKAFSSKNALPFSIYLYIVASFSAFLPFLS
ncbi:MAG: undecaprenyl-diphosphate phosphatase [Clostridia bacterium]|nr:undecaprenyl-diphosphate phosphatase [Clostridia bacterium]